MVHSFYYSIQSACPREYNGEIGTNDGAVVDGVSGDEDPGITDIDELSFAHESPLIVIPGKFNIYYKYST